MEKIEKYNKKAADPKNKSKEIIQSLDIKEDMKILEIGFGGGYFAEKFSDIIGKNGIYYGIDTDIDCVKYLEKVNQQSLYKNMKCILSKPEEILNLDIEFDLIFSRNVYHHLSGRVKYFMDMAKYLKENGKLVIIDYDSSFSWHRIKFSSHYTKIKVIKKEMSEAGYSLVNSFDFLPIQSFLVFEKKKD
ncbi:MAG: methyltransferase domain-containing protein [Ignavibacteria bacterium]|jgi:arsenite methyltransferase|nr:methyltransferase domain-containing protein [Ignavibacteria bacterium]